MLLNISFFAKKHKSQKNKTFKIKNLPPNTSKQKRLKRIAGLKVILKKNCSSPKNLNILQNKIPKSQGNKRNRNPKTNHHTTQSGL